MTTIRTVMVPYSIREMDDMLTRMKREGWEIYEVEKHYILQAPTRVLDALGLTEYRHQFNSIPELYAHYQGVENCIAAIHASGSHA